MRSGVTPRTIDPFTPILAPTLAKRIKELLLSPRVQEINFDFGSVLVHAYHFRAIAGLFVLNLDLKLEERGIHVVIAPEFLRAEKAVGKYLSKADAMYFESAHILGDEIGRSTAVHECVHAVCDYRRRDTAIRSEEGAAMVAEAWFRLTFDGIIIEDDVPERAWEVARRLRSRWLATRKPVSLRASEINALRLEAARKGFENAHYDHNGIATA